MFSNKRKLRRRNIKIHWQRKKIIFIGTCTVTVILISFGAFFYFSALHKKDYVSPITFHSQPEKYDPLPNLKKLLTDQKIAFNNVTLSNDAYIISLQNNSQVFFSRRKDLNSQISSLQYIVSRLTMEGRLFKRLDLRFDKPVIEL